MKNRDTTALLLELVNRVKDNKATGSLWSTEQVIEQFISDYKISDIAADLPYSFHTVVKPFTI